MTIEVDPIDQRSQGQRATISKRTAAIAADKDAHAMGARRVQQPQRTIKSSAFHQLDIDAGHLAHQRRQVGHGATTFVDKNRKGRIRLHRTKLMLKPPRKRLLELWCVNES